jgi:hypothetical protein
MPRWRVHEGLRCQVAIVPWEMELTDLELTIESLEYNFKRFRVPLRSVQVILQRDYMGHRSEKGET